MKSIENNEMGIDDVSISGSLFRMERMTDTTFWVCMYGKNGRERIAFDLSVGDGGKLYARLIEDSIKEKQ